MTLQELLEHAHLDALGQLDEREQAAFETAFAVAPPAVQAQIRKAQERIAGMDHLLPQVEPPAYLREKVLTAVHAAMLADGAGSDAGEGLRPAHRVGTAWRTATVCLVAAVIVLGGAFVNVYMANESINRSVQEGAAYEGMVSNFGRQYINDALYSANVTRAIFQPAVSDFPGKASVWVSPDWQTAQMFCKLPARPGQVYRVVQLDDNDKPLKTLREFEANGSDKPLDFGLVASGTRLGIVSAVIGSTAEPILLMVATV
jgi:hypothetical protein